MGKLVGHGMELFTGLHAGNKRREFSYQYAQALMDAAHRRMARATTEAASERKNKERIRSTAIAHAAASGAGVDDPTVVNVIADLNTEGEYRALARMWTGQDEAQGIRFRAEAARREGDAALNSAYINFAKTVLSTATDKSGGSYKDMWNEAKEDWGKVKKWAAHAFS